MARKNPTITTTTPANSPVEGVDRFPVASGVNIKALEDGNAMPEVNMSPNDGDQKGVPDAPFANGTDMRNKTGGSNSNPNPGKPGA